jgi:hypothetical protein
MSGVVAFFDALEMAQVYEHEVFCFQVSFHMKVFVLVDDEFLYTTHFTLSSRYLHRYSIFSRMSSSVSVLHMITSRIGRAT